jgi:cell division protein ZapB
MISRDGCIMGVFDLDLLERQVDELIRLCDRLQEENVSLRASQEHLVGERADLIEKTELARSKVEAMVARLKSMEEQL